MNPDWLPLSWDDDIMHERKDRYRQIAEQVKHLNHLTKNAFSYLTMLQTKHLKKVPLRNIEFMAPYYKAWLECLITDYHHYKAFVEGTSLSVANAIFTTLSQYKFIMRYNDIVKQKPEITELKMVSNGEAIWSFKQSDMTDAILHLSAQINFLPFDQIPKFLRRLEALHVRNSVFFCEYASDQVLDMPSMRRAAETNKELFCPNDRYLQFSTIYFHRMYERVFFYDLLKEGFCELPENISELAAHFENYFDTNVCRFLGQDGVRDVYGAACQVAYECAGDREWHSVLHPDLSPSLLNLLQMNRKDLVASYVTSEQLTKMPILAQVKTEPNTIRGYAARTFVLLGLDKFMSAYSSCASWLNCIQLSADNFFSRASLVKLAQHKVPLLIQVFGRFCVYSQKKVWATDCIYTALALWFFILKRDYDCRLLELDFSKITEKVFPQLFQDEHHPDDERL